jgi:hypothetical protein
MFRIALIAGERPDPIDHTFLDDDGDVIDLTGWDGEATWEHMSTGATGSLVGAVDGPTGTVTVTLTDTVCGTAGVVDVTVWAGDGSTRYASPVYRLSLSDPPGTAPSI